MHINVSLRQRSTAIAAACLVVVAATGAPAYAASARPAAGPACTITGTAASETLTGTDGDDVICGLGGNDVLIGNGGNDILIGGSGNDTLEGDAGNDTFDGGPGVDTCVQGTGNGAITNCEALSEPTMSIGDAAVAEGNPGDNNQLVFTVTLASPLGVTATAHYATVDGTATAPSDYHATTGTLSIPAGSTSTTVSVAVVGDSTFEPDETMTLVLSNAVAASLGDDATGTGTITNDDPQYQLNIADVSGPESQKSFMFNVTLTPPSTSDVFVQYQTIDQTASSPADYAGTIGELEIPAGASSAKIKIPIVDDAFNEPTETFLVTLTDPVGASITDGSATGTILDNDPVPHLTVANSSIAEGNSGTTMMPFTATLGVASGYTVTGVFTVTSGTALVGYDIPSTQVSVNFPPGTTTATVLVPINGDTTPEHDETFTIHLVGGQNVVLDGATATGTILNDDAGIVIDEIGSQNKTFFENVEPVSTAVSSDGRYVAFIYNATSRHSSSSVAYVRDRVTGTLTEVGENTTRFATLSDITISGDGRFVAWGNDNSVVVINHVDFSSHTINSAFTPSLDGDGGEMAYATASGVNLYNTATGVSTPISSDGGYPPVISADGTHVAHADGNGNIQVYNVSAGTTAVASVASNGTAANDVSAAPSISADGNEVAFTSAASNLVAGDTNGVADVFRHDMATGVTTRMSVANDGSQLPTGGNGASISGDGTAVAFLAGGSSPSALFVRSTTGTTTSVTASARSAVLSGDGHTLVFVSDATLVDGVHKKKTASEIYAANL